MTLLLIAMALAGLLALLRWLFRSAPRPPYQISDAFLTPTELAFFRSIEKAVDGEQHIFIKIRVADLLCVAPGTENAAGWFAKIAQKHIDFVLADRENVRPVLAIELDDSTHERPERRERDAFVDAALASANLPLLRVKAAGEYDAREIAGRIGSLVDR